MFEAFAERQCSVTHVGSVHPCLDRFLIELQEDSLTLILKGRQPRDLSRQSRPFDPDVQLAFSVGRSRFKPSEANLGDNLAQTMHQNDAFNRNPLDSSWRRCTRAVLRCRSTASP